MKTLSQVSLSSLEAVLLHKRLCIHLRLSQFSTPQPLVVQDKKFVEADSQSISFIKIGISDSDHVSSIPIVMLKPPLVYLSVLLADSVDKAPAGLKLLFATSICDWKEEQLMSSHEIKMMKLTVALILGTSVPKGSFYFLFFIEWLFLSYHVHFRRYRHFRPFLHARSKNQRNC